MRLAQRLFISVLLLLFYVSLLSTVNAQQQATNAPPGKTTGESRVTLREGWELQTSAKVDAKGEVISTPAFATKGWHTAIIPSTVVAAEKRVRAWLAEDGEMMLGDRKLHVREVIERVERQLRR